MKKVMHSAAWHAANRRKGYEEDARKDQRELARATRSVGGGLLRGVNLGGWLLLERWMCRQVFGELKEEEAPDEFSLCRKLGGDKERVIGEWRRSWITRKDLEEVKAVGFNTIRVPLGYWCVQEEEEEEESRDPFVPCCNIIEEMLDWARDLKLSVLLDLHSAPGFQSGHHATGKKDATWQPSNWNMKATLQVLRHLARRYGQHESVKGICVLNEPSAQISNQQLADFYRSAYTAIRQASSSSSSTTTTTTTSSSSSSSSCPLLLLFPVYQRRLADLIAAGFPSPDMHDIMLDVHVYQCFGKHTWRRRRRGGGTCRTSRSCYVASMNSLSPSGVSNFQRGPRG
mmetsp:Transcript_9263/g.30915  ORF Transcript_9263/g.30915 Transcript_9263/m.30915 type:complete len:343 (-) Transcript_9263:233-1261(-)